MSYDITYDIYNADLEWHATLNKVIWHHIWHLQCWLRIACDIEQSHMTSHMTFECYPKVACDIIWCHFGVIWHHMWHVHGVGMCDRHCVIYTRYMLYTKHKQASAASLHRGGRGTLPASAAPSHQECHVMWSQNDIIWHHMWHSDAVQRVWCPEWLANMMSYDIKMTSYDVTCDFWAVTCDMSKSHMTSHVTLAAASNVTYDIMWHHMTWLAPCTDVGFHLQNYS